MAVDADKANGLPLTGVVLCSTSVPQDLRNQLSSYATEMGATHKLDLTADVTHLLVGDIRTPKYRYVAKSRPDIKALKPEFIEEIRQQWLDGNDVDVEALEEQYRLPTLHGLCICVTGFADADIRSQLEETARHHGAIYSGDLTRHVTHLIVATPFGAKYTHAKQWGIACVSLKWLDDSIGRSMALDESLYDPVLPEEEQGKGAFKIEAGPASRVSKRAREEEAGRPGKRKFRRTASSKLSEHSQDLWQDISAADGLAEESGTDQWQENNVAASKAITPAAVAPTVVEQHTATKLFSGWRMCIQGFDPSKTKRLKSVLSDMCGADVVDRPSELRLATVSSYCIVIPHHPPETLDYLSTTPAETTVATEWWVERCIHSKTILDPAQDALSRPFWRANMPDMSGVRISSTGLNSIDLRQIAEVIAIVGATYEEQLAPTTSVLISGTTAVKKEKAFYAKKHNIPVVASDWLWTSIESKRKESFAPYQIINNSTQMPQSSRATVSASSRLQKRKAGPFVHEDDTAQPSAPLVQTKTNPLAERSPNMSPRKSQSKEAGEPEKEKPNTVEEEDRTSEALVQNISSLARHLRESRAASNGTEDTQPKRRKRTLGRAASAISNRSVSAEVSLDDRLDPWDHQDQAKTIEQQVPAPGTQLGYDVPEVEAHRLQMALKMGSSFSDELNTGRKLESLGTVKDMEMPSKVKRLRMHR